MRASLGLTTTKAISASQQIAQAVSDSVVVKTKKIDKTVEKNGNEIIHRGISQRSFSRSFTIADDVKVGDAELKDGLLTISCEKIVPEQKKKKLIPIK